jgi:uncharacterized protein YbaP (TraB family)
MPGENRRIDRIRVRGDIMPKPSIWRRYPTVPGALLAVALCVIPFSSTAAEAMPYGKGLLWKIEAPGRAPSYVFGTMHVSDKRVTTLPKPVRDALDEVIDLNLEIDFSSGFGDYEDRMIHLPKTQRLRTILGDALFAKVKKRLGGEAVNETTLERLKPWVVLLSLGQRPVGPGSPEAERRLPLDLKLREIALRRGIPVFGIENHTDHLNVFNKLSEADQVTMIREALARPERDVKREIEEMIHLYVARDLSGLIALTRKMQDRSKIAGRAEFEKRLLPDRNRIMARHAENVLIDGGAFIAVGAAHLPGETGLLTLLAKRGYAVTRVY